MVSISFASLAGCGSPSSQSLCPLMSKSRSTTPNRCGPPPAGVARHRPAAPDRPPAPGPPPPAAPALLPAAGGWRLGAAEDPQQSESPRGKIPPLTSLLLPRAVVALPLLFVLRGEDEELRLERKQELPP